MQILSSWQQLKLSFTKFDGYGFFLPSIQAFYQWKYFIWESLADLVVENNFDSQLVQFQGFHFSFNPLHRFFITDDQNPFSLDIPCAMLCFQGYDLDFSLAIQF
jgi:hypothetical protein